MTEKFISPTEFKLISGAQSGADRAGLDWAIALGIAHGGWCPKGRKSEDGPIDPKYSLQETPGANYLQRTEWNVRDSDATVIFTLASKLDGGSKQTANFAEQLRKPWIHIREGVHPKFLARFLTLRKVHTLNVAGKRESSHPGIYDFTRRMLSDAIEHSHHVVGQ